MKKAIWILFVGLALLWTALAWAASGLARWTSDAIASERMAQAAQQLARKAESATRTVTTPLSDKSGNVADQATPIVTPPVGQAVADAVQKSIDAAKSARDAAIATLPPVPPLPALPALPALPPSPPLPPLPPMPEWVGQLFGAEAVQSFKEWATWAKVAAGVTSQQMVTAAQSATDTAAAQANATGAALTSAIGTTSGVANTVNAAAVTATPWLAGAIGWLVPIVWIIWGIGLLVGFVATLIAQWALGRFFGGRPA